MNLVAQLEAAIALLAEERIAEDHVRLRILIAEPLHLVRDVGDRACAIAREDSVRAVRAELGAAAAREQRIPAADRPRRPPDPERLAAILGDEIPPRKRQRVEIVDLLAHDDARWNVASGHAHDGGFGLAVQD